MKLLVDARMLRSGGIGRFLREVTSRWLTDGGVESIRFLGTPEELEPWLRAVGGDGRGRVVAFPYPPYSPRAQAAWALRSRELRGDADVTLFPHYDVPIFRHPEPSVVVVHDLTQYLALGSFPWGKRAAGRVLLKRAVMGARKVVTVSERSRADLERVFPQLEGAVDVVAPGVSEAFRKPTSEERDASLVRWGGLRPYLLVVGPDKPHKNLELAAEVLADLATDMPDLRLVQVGPRNEEGGPMQARARCLGVDRRVVTLGRLDDESLVQVYQLASALLFPSRYEGFGLPPLEARACGTPVLSSDVGAIREVLGGDVHLLEPDDARAWADTIREVRCDRPTPGRADDPHVIQPRPRPTWTECASKLLDTLSRAAE